MNIFALFAVTDFEAAQAVLEQRFDANDVLRVGEGQWLIAADKTTAQLYEHLALEKEELSGIVLSAESIRGYHNQDYWEWVNLKRAK